MFGMIGKMRAAPGKRADLIAILGESTEAMPGCLSYIVMPKTHSDPDGIWITEVWDNETSHKASLQLPLRAGRHREGPADHRRFRHERENKACRRPLTIRHVTTRIRPLSSS